MSTLNISRWFKAAIEEPYRIFFPLGILWGIVGISHWLFYAVKWIPAYSMQLHSAIQISGYMGCFIVGFLLTAMPRFASAPPANSREFLIFLILVNAAPVLYLRHEWTYARLCFAAWLLMLSFFAVRRFRSKKSVEIEPPVEFVWIPAALLNGLLGVLLMTGADAHVLPGAAGNTGKLLSEQGFLLSIVLGVGSFLGPRLMGTFRPSFQTIQDIKIRKSQRRNALCYHAAAAFCLLMTFFLEGTGHPGAAFAARALIIGLIYFRSRTLVLKPLAKDQFATLLCISFWMVFIGHISLVFFPAYRSTLLHITFLGGYSLMTFAIATMVIFSHGGEMTDLKQAVWQLPSLGALLALALCLRVAAIFFPESFFALLGAASLCWLFAAVLWFLFVLKPILKCPSSKEEFERCHEDAKARVAALRSGLPLDQRKPREG